jgi:hypothetical protein
MVPKIARPQAPSVAECVKRICDVCHIAGEAVVPASGDFNAYL